MDDKLLKMAMAKSAGFRLMNADGRDVTQKTLAALLTTMGGGGGLQKAETITTSDGLVAYDLEAPSRNLYPVLTPLRNRIPRIVKNSGAGTGAHWKEVTAITGSGVTSMAWVPEGQRAARMSLTTQDRSASYVTLGEEADLSFEAESAAAGFEDVMASTGMRLLQMLMIKEEYAILGGNRNVALGTPSAPTVTTSSTGGSIGAGTYNVAVVALTLEGYAAASLSGGVKTQESITGQDSKTFNLNGGSSNKSSTSSTGALTGTTNVIKATVTAIKGAVAYAWYAGESGSETLQAITTINSVELTSLTTGYQDLSDISADRSKNATYAFDGLLYAAFNSSQAYYKALATGTAGTGTGLTASGRGSIDEIDNMLESFWSNYRISPEEIYVNAQELRNITEKVLTGSGTPMIRFNFDINEQNPSVVAGQVVGYYFNPFSMNGGQLVPIRLHPNLPAGTIFTWAENLPGSYQSANVPFTARMQCRRDYYQIPWPLVTRARETGVYAEEVLKVYAPFALGIITNIGDA
jgi:hypothetical protein